MRALAIGVALLSCTAFAARGGKMRVALDGSVLRVGELGDVATIVQPAHVVPTEPIRTSEDSGEPAAPEPSAITTLEAIIIAVCIVAAWTLPQHFNSQTDRQLQALRTAVNTLCASAGEGTLLEADFQSHSTDEHGALSLQQRHTQVWS